MSAPENVIQELVSLTGLTYDQVCAAYNPATVERDLDEFFAHKSGPYAQAAEYGPVHDETQLDRSQHEDASIALALQLQEEADEEEHRRQAARDAQAARDSAVAQALDTDDAASVALAQRLQMEVDTAETRRGHKRGSQHRDQREGDAIYRSIFGGDDRSDPPVQPGVGAASVVFTGDLSCECRPFLRPLRVCQ